MLSIALLTSAACGGRAEDSESAPQGGAGSATLPPSGSPGIARGGTGGTAGNPTGGGGGDKAGGNPGGGCPTIGCLPEFQYRVLLPDSFDDPIEIQVETCRNDECLAVDLSIPRDAIGPGSGLGKSAPAGELENSPRMTVTAWGTENDKLPIDIEFRLWSPGDVRDGDVYRVSISDAEGESLFGREIPVRYALEKPIPTACQTCPKAVPLTEQ